MKHRVLILALALLLSLNCLLFSAAASEQYPEAYETLSALAGPVDPETGAASASFPLEDGVFRLSLETDRLLLSLERDGWTLSLALPETEAALLESWAVRDGAEVWWSLEPQSFTGMITLEPAAMDGDTEAAFALEEAAGAALPELVELIGVIGGDRSLPEKLGFTAFSFHKYHDYDEGSVTTPPSCGREGVKTYTCRVCGETKTEPVPATGKHQWNSGVVTTAPTCVKEGVRTYTCKVCSQTKTEPIPATGKHQWNSGAVTTAPTCVKKGVRTYTCKVCGQTKTESIPATGVHKWDKGVITKAPTCTAAGVRTYTCMICKTATKTETVTALGHAWTVKATTSEIETNADVHGKADFICSRCGAAKSGKRCAAQVFTDMPAESNWAHAPIEWAYFNGITGGKTLNRFAPKATCTRAEVMTFLWACHGKPEPAKTAMPFQDVKTTAYYYKAVLWAVQNGITGGKTSTRFAPKDNCTRAQVMTFIWSCNGKPEPKTSSSLFTDVKPGAYYYKPVLWAAENGITGGKTATTFGPKDACTRAQIMAFLYKASRLDTPQAIWTQSFHLYYGETELETRVLCRGNHPYVDQAVMTKTFGSPSGSNRWPAISKLGHSYMTLADAAARYGFRVCFRMEDSSVHIYKLSSVSWTVTQAKGNEKPAYIRLEDIMADYGLNNRFTHDSLTRLRLFGDFLQAKGDAFYVAWIPLYVNPGKDVENDISTRFNFYNVDFVFSLDCLQRNGGRLGLHGLSHQDHDSVSASGFEFGASNNLTEAQMLDRFTRAEAIAERLGYSWYFFEFPHYASTPFQRTVAEKHFDVVYQQYPGEHEGYIVTHSYGSHKCRWIPTPCNYVDGLGDKQAFYGRLQTAKQQGKLMSFFFHPYVDTRFLTYQIDGTSMSCDYDTSIAALPEAVRQLTEWGYRFKAF